MYYCHICVFCFPLDSNLKIFPVILKLLKLFQSIRQDPKTKLQTTPQYCYLVPVSQKFKSRLLKFCQKNTIIYFAIDSLALAKRQCLLHQPGFQHLIAAAPAAAVVLFCCSIYYLSSWHCCLSPKSNNKILEKKKGICIVIAL